MDLAFFHIISFDKDVVQGVLAAGASEESLTAALGYSNTKPVDADRVVRVTDENGNVVSEEATNADGEAAARVAAEGIATENQSVCQLTILDFIAMEHTFWGTRHFLGSIVSNKMCSRFWSGSIGSVWICR